MIACFGTPKALQGEKAVGNGWTPLSTPSIPCQRVWLGAPAANHPKGGTNTSGILVAISPAQPTTTGGCRTIASDGSKDQYIHVNDANLIWLKGFTDGDSIEYSIEGVPQNQT